MKKLILIAMLTISGYILSADDELAIAGNNPELPTRDTFNTMEDDQSIENPEEHQNNSLDSLIESIQWNENIENHKGLFKGILSDVYIKALSAFREYRNALENNTVDKEEKKSNFDFCQKILLEFVKNHSDYSNKNYRKYVVEALLNDTYRDFFNRDL